MLGLHPLLHHPMNHKMTEFRLFVLFFAIQVIVTQASIYKLSKRIDKLEK